MARSYTQQNHQEHLRYLDILKQNFVNRFANPSCDHRVLENFDIINTLGNGAYGNVFLVRDKGTLTYHAMKVVEKEAVIERDNVKHIMLEKKLLQCVNFPFVTNLEFSFKDNLYLFMILPYVAGGELFTFVQKFGCLSETLSKFYACQVVLSLEYLHYCNIIHRDIKPENILVDTNGYIKVCDFGFSKIVKNKTWTLCGTPEYLAPEVILSKGYSFPVDWWALGILIYEMSSGIPPFFSASASSLYEKILEGQYKCPDSMSSDCKHLLKGLLQLDPLKRYGALKHGSFDIKSHNWFSDISWQSILHQSVEPPFIPISSDPGDTVNFPDVSEVKLRKASACRYEKEFEDF